MAQSYWPQNGYPQSQQTWNPAPNPPQAPPTWPPPNPSGPGQYPPAPQPSSFGYPPPPPTNYAPQGTYQPQPQPQPPAPATHYYQYQTALPLPPNNQYGVGNQQPTQPPASSYQPTFAPPQPQNPGPPPPPSAFPPAQQTPTYFSPQALYNQAPPQTAPAQPVNNGQYPPTNTAIWTAPNPVTQPPQPTQTLPSSYPFPNLNNSGPQNSYGGYAPMHPPPTSTVNAGVQATLPSYTSTNSGRPRLNTGSAPHVADRKRKTSSSTATPVRNSTHWQCCECNYSTVNGYRNEITGKYEHCRFDTGFVTHRRCRRCRDEFGVAFTGE